MRSIALAAASAAAALSMTTPAQAASYTIDPNHTFVTFEIDHNGTSTNRGRFDKVQGSIEFDRDAKTGQADISVDMRSISTGTPGFDKHLQSADIFNAEQFATARFVSERFVFEENGKIDEIHGQLTLLGQTHPVTIEAEKFNCYANRMLQGRETCGGDFEFSIDRTRWGLNYATQYGAAKEVKIIIQIEAAKAQ